MPAEGCGGGNSWSTIVQAFYNNGHTEQTGVVSADKLTIEGNKIVIHGLDYADTDPRCCPSKHIAQKFVIQGNKLVETK